MAINKPDFLAGYSLFYESARYGGDFMAAIENTRDFSMSPSLALRSAIFTKSMGAATPITSLCKAICRTHRNLSIKDLPSEQQLRLQPLHSSLCCLQRGFRVKS